MKPDTITIAKNGSANRNANVELLRLICMYMILTGHCMAASGALYVPKSFNYYFYWWIEMLCVPSVNVFVLITGYYQVNAKFHLKSLGKVLWVVWCYSFLLSFAASKIGGVPLSRKDLLILLLPILCKRYWFVNAYLLLYLFSPFLNRLIYALSKAQLSLLVGILCASMILRPTVFPRTYAQDTTTGLTVFYLIVLYFIAAWIRLYGQKLLSRPRQCTLFYFIISVAVTIMRYAMLSAGIGEDTVFRFYVNDNLAVVLEALFLFLAFLGGRPIEGKWKQGINSVARHAFSLYIVHYSLNTVLWTKILHVDRFVGSFPLGILAVFAAAALMFAVIIIVETGREKLAEKCSGVFRNTGVGKKLTLLEQKWDTIANEG